MPFTAKQLNNIANQALDFHIDKAGKPFAQALEDQPMTAFLVKAQKIFPGGKGSITGNVKGDYVSEFEGYSDDDTVTYKNPAEVKQFSYPWKELHAGIQFTLTELKKVGIQVVDSMTGENTVNASRQEQILLSNILEDKYDDLTRGKARSFDQIMHRDGSQDSKAFAGVASFLSETPTVGITGGLDRATHAWWRNRYAAITHNVTNTTLIKTLKSEVRQLRRFGGSPNGIFAGSVAMEKLEAEYVAKGSFTVTGFDGKTELDIGDFNIRGVGKVTYDPTLDNEGKEDYIYFLDSNHLHPMVMDGEDNKRHSPARPAEKYVKFLSITWTGGLICNRLNSQGVYVIS